MNCTWKDCPNIFAIPQLDRNGEAWSHLCEAHAKRLDDSIISMDPKRVMRDWILAQGGAEKAAKRTMEGLA